MEILQFFETLMEMIYDTYETISLAATTIAEFDFAESPFITYMGYARYAMGDPLYITFTSVCVISLGFQMWTITLKGIQIIKEICFK